MQRQRSILSFFQKPSPENQPPSDPFLLSGPRFTQFPVNQHQQQQTLGDVEVRGTDTPPEKVPRQILPEKFTRNHDSVNSNSNGSSLFSSLMHKFVKIDERENERKQSECNLSNNCSKTRNLSTDLSIQRSALQNMEGNKVVNYGEKIDQVSCSVKNGDDDILGPETPGMQPCVPRLKRVQDNYCDSENKHDISLLGTSKRLKLLKNSAAENNNQVSDSNSKFDWLSPSSIRDANGRRPGDALYDKKTLYIPPDALNKMSASQKQYWNVKCKYMDVVLFFKVGKFYELYELDAEIGHKELGWKITLSGVGKCQQVGISESGIDEAVQKLVARGYKVGRMEQLETSDQAKARGASGVIQRKLVHVLTPSTTVDGNIGPDAVHLLAIKEGNNDLEDNDVVYGFAFVDCASLKFWVGSVRDDNSCAALGALLMQVAPKEIIYESQGLSREAQKALKKYSVTGSRALQLTPVLPNTEFLDASEVRNQIESKGYFKGSCKTLAFALDGVLHHDVALFALGGLISHLSRLMLDDALHNGDILPYEVYRGCLKIDGQTLVNLEIFGNSADGGTLYGYLSNCMTSSGKRLLRNWICHPLKDVEEINKRLDVVEDLMAHNETMILMAKYLKKLPDLERLLGCIKAAVKSSATLLLPLVGKKVLKQRVKAFGCLVKGLRIGMDLLKILQEEGHAIPLFSRVVKIPMLSGSDGLDKFLTQFEAAIDSDFPKYQDHGVADSDAEILSVLIEIFIEKASQWSELVQAISHIDVLRSFAVTASFSLGSMSRPLMLPQTKPQALCQEGGGPVLKIKGLWHPFALGANGVPVPNDINLGENADGCCPQTLLLTGPNMGGKSTLLRATCLAVILAQLGAYVPCEVCVLSVVDIIFTRLGATDRIMTGEKTASVLQNATQDSLVLLDELGRGTSTFDGYAIAYAVFRHLIENVNCRLLFATHYHPLTREFATHPHVTLQHMLCLFKSKPGCSSNSEEELVFLYRLASGACPESYGLKVAVMAGIPSQVVKAASVAGQTMKQSIRESFKSSELRSEFSTLHEQWLTTLLAMSRIQECDVDDDASDTLVCLWHELKNSYTS
ncbi:DNA mismatch repair protein MutS, connector domain [Dillenia turbinata]|uniref:DNA mismatch repair protein MutS, connector domain n=1 Tax=Dillenia turbinata TaxID=194707 RepID=A0AAN8W1F6_9MAGN